MNVNDIQGNVLAGFNKPHQRFALLRLADNTAHARRWLEETRRFVARGDAVAEHNALFKKKKAKDTTWTGVGLTWSGLVRLGTPDLVAVLREDYAFRVGPQVRAPDLGDVGRSAPERWLLGPVDAVVTLAADQQADVEAALTAVGKTAKRFGAEVVHVLVGERPASGREHFGFREGGSQPRVEGVDDDPDTRPGEIVVGEPAVVPRRGPVPSWLESASFQVVRVLEQDVRRWRAESAGKDEQWIGRTRDGDRLRSTPKQSHTAKAVPAAAFDPARRRLVRRGIPYGPAFEEDPRAERGLIFNAFMASIDRQYEYVQSMWANREDFPEPRTGRDRVIGAPSARGGYQPSYARYVTTRGAVYAVAPGLDGLEELAGGTPHQGGGGVLLAGGKAASSRRRRSGSPAARRRSPA
jgi:Dyp-type peroxidase family